MTGTKNESRTPEWELYDLKEDPMEMKNLYHDPCLLYTSSISDMDGRFSLDASEKDILLISYIGYMTKEVKIGKQHSLSLIHI